MPGGYRGIPGTPLPPHRGAAALQVRSLSQRRLTAAPGRCHGDMQIDTADRGADRLKATGHAPRGGAGVSLFPYIMVRVPFSFSVAAAAAPGTGGERLPPPGTVSEEEEGQEKARSLGRWGRGRCQGRQEGAGRALPVPRHWESAAGSGNNPAPLSRAGEVLGPPSTGLRFPRRRGEQPERCEDPGVRRQLGAEHRRRLQHRNPISNPCGAPDRSPDGGVCLQPGAESRRSVREPG